VYGSREGVRTCQALCSCNVPRDFFSCLSTTYRVRTQWDLTLNVEMDTQFFCGFDIVDTIIFKDPLNGIVEGRSVIQR